MREIRPVRLIRKRETQAPTQLSASATPLARPEPSEREMKTVVSSWVRDHRQRSEEFRRTFATLWQAGECLADGRTEPSDVGHALGVINGKPAANVEHIAAAQFLAPGLAQQHAAGLDGLDMLEGVR